MNDREAKLVKIQKVVDKMPTLSTTVSKVLEICSRQDTSPNDLNKVISLDPVLTGQVLKLINSAYYSLVNKVTSLTRAIIMLGLNTVKNLALSTSIIRCIEQAKKTKALPIKQFWAHSIGVGVMAKMLAAEQGVDIGQREEYFVAGLLHDLGKIPFGDEYIKVIQSAQQQMIPLIDVERDQMGIDHEEVGALIARKWKLNLALTDAICHHHTPFEAAPENQRLVATIALANFYTCIFEIGSAGNKFPDEKQLEPLFKITGLHWDIISKLSEQVEQEIAKAEIFLQV